MFLTHASSYSLNFELRNEIKIFFVSIFFWKLLTFHLVQINHFPWANCVTYKNKKKIKMKMKEETKTPKNVKIAKRQLQN